MMLLSAVSGVKVVVSTLRYSPLMRPLLKSLLLWLLALALPVQALAAAGMQHCGASHERMRVAPAAHAHAHEEAAGGGHEHHHAAAPAAEAQDDHAGSGAGLAGFSCSACAACCIALALPAAGVRSAAPPPEAYASALSAVPVPPYVTGGLDRPPRGALA
jgi:hypothetical protein